MGSKEIRAAHTEISAYRVLEIKIKKTVGIVRILI